jgi:hypothetical protein
MFFDEKIIVRINSIQELNVLEVIVQNETETEIAHIKHLPDSCPICNKGIEPKFINGVKHDEYALQLMLQCTFRDCKKLFIANYYRIQRGEYFNLKFVTPRNPIKQEFDQVINEVSPDFVSIYNEAYEAEQRRLTQICGPGYRKALEFLIKSYLISIEPNDTDIIEKTPLQECITKRIPDGNLKTCAKRAVWLGNDETHFRRKWKNKDISDFHTLIELTIYWIIGEIKTKQFSEEMQESKPPKE